MAETANDRLLSDSVSHAVGLQRLSTGVVRRVISILNRVDDDLVRQLQKYDPTAVGGSYSQRRLEKLLDAIRVVNKEAYAAVTKALTDELRGLAGYEGEFQARMIQSASPVRLDIVTPSASQLFAAVQSRPFQGRVLRQWARDMEAGALRQVQQAIRIGFVEGESISQITTRITGRRANQYRDGILEINRRNAEAVVRTAVNHTANAARHETYRQNSDLIKGIVYVATLDGRTTLRCISLDGKVFPLDSGPRPPQHYRCRSSTAPVLRSFRELGIDLDELPPGSRASLNGQVPGKVTYGEWLRKQPREFQEDVLGKTKAKLFRDGKLSVDKFVDRRGMEYDLDELRRRESEAWERAGLAA